MRIIGSRFNRSAFLEKRENDRCSLFLSRGEISTRKNGNRKLSAGEEKRIETATRSIARLLL